MLPPPVATLIQRCELSRDWPRIAVSVTVEVHARLAALVAEAVHALHHLRGHQLLPLGPQLRAVRVVDLDEDEIGAVVGARLGQRALEEAFLEAAEQEQVRVEADDAYVRVVHRPPAVSVVHRAVVGQVEVAIVVDAVAFVVAEHRVERHVPHEVRSGIEEVSAPRIVFVSVVHEVTRHENEGQRLVDDAARLRRQEVDDPVVDHLPQHRRVGGIDLRVADRHHSEGHVHVTSGRRPEPRHLTRGGAGVRAVVVAGRRAQPRDLDLVDTVGPLARLNRSRRRLGQVDVREPPLDATLVRLGGLPEDPRGAGGDVLHVCMAERGSPAPGRGRRGARREIRKHT